MRCGLWPKPCSLANLLRLTALISPFHHPELNITWRSCMWERKLKDLRNPAVSLVQSPCNVWLSPCVNRWGHFPDNLQRGVDMSTKCWVLLLHTLFCLLHTGQQKSVYIPLMSGFCVQCEYLSSESTPGVDWPCSPPGYLLHPAQLWCKHTNSLSFSQVRCFDVSWG